MYYLKIFLIMEPIQAISDQEYHSTNSFLLCLTLWVKLYFLCTERPIASAAGSVD